MRLKIRCDVESCKILEFWRELNKGLVGLLYTRDSSTAALTVLHQSLSKVQARQGEDMHEDLWFDLHHRNDQVIRIKLVLRL